MTEDEVAQEEGEEGQVEEGGSPYALMTDAWPTAVKVTKHTRSTGALVHWCSGWNWVGTGAFKHKYIEKEML